LPEVRQDCAFQQGNPSQNRTLRFQNGIAEGKQRLLSNDQIVSPQREM
jgi:hypothetical protein